MSGSEPQEGQGGEADSKPEAEDQEPKDVTFTLGVVMVRTKRLLKIIDDLARFRVFSDISWLYLVIMVLAGAFMIWIMLDENYILLTSSLALRCLMGAAPVSQCQASNLATGSRPALTTYLLLPGINHYIPVVYGIIGIVIAVVVHEGSHGVIAERLGLPVKSTGLVFFLFIPIGAFVELDEKAMRKLRPRDSVRILAGGPGSNTIVGLVALVLLVIILGGLVPVSGGVLVTQYESSSPAYTLHSNGHLQLDDFITAVNGTRIDSEQDLANFMANTKPNETLLISISHLGQTSTYPITLGANPGNASIGYIGVVVSQYNLSTIRNNYSGAYVHDPLLYLIVPGIVPQAETVVPFSDTLHVDYSSPVLGSSWYQLALVLFWIFFININLAIFNAIPLYPLDGGQALLAWLSNSGRKWFEQRAKLLTTICSVAMVLLILSLVFLPAILSLIPY